MIQRGFTLIEVLLAMLIAAMAMAAVSGVFITTMQTHYEIDNLTSSTADGQRILTLLERDLYALWHHDVQRNRVMLGRKMDISGYDADRIDLLTSSDAIGGVLDNQMELSHPSICEVGYWLKENPDIPGLLELWRREDPMVDDDLLTGGHFQLVSDRIKNFRLTYYETLGYEAEPLDEWDSSLEGRLPRRIRVEFTIHRKIGNRNEISGAEVEDLEKVLKSYVRHIVFDRRYPDILQAGVAMLPVAPMPPSAAEADGPIGAAGDGGQGDGSGSTGGSGSDPSSGTRPPGGDNSTTRPGGDSGQAPPTQPPTGSQPQPGFDLGDLLRGAGKGSGQDWFGGR